MKKNGFYIYFYNVNYVESSPSSSLFEEFLKKSKSTCRGSNKSSQIEFPMEASIDMLASISKGLEKRKK